MFNTHVIETVHECIEGEWTYRFYQNEKGVHVKRTPSKDPLWSHGVITQTFESEQKKFLSQCLAGWAEYFDSVSEAKRAIQKVLTA